MINLITKDNKIAPIIIIKIFIAFSLKIGLSLCNISFNFTFPLLIFFNLFNYLRSMILNYLSNLRYSCELPPAIARGLLGYGVKNINSQLYEMYKELYRILNYMNL